MTKEIVNRVAKSPLVTVDLEALRPPQPRVGIDLKDWLESGLVLREQAFREKVTNYNWEAHQDQYVALFCSSDAIMPTWAAMLITTALEPFAKKVVWGDFETLEILIFESLIDSMPLEKYQNKPIIIKGCSNNIIPTQAYIKLIEKLCPVAKSILFGEACSAVPLYKNKTP